LQFLCEVIFSKSLYDHLFSENYGEVEISPKLRI
jgi:hypothetical protein